MSENSSSQPDSDEPEIYVAEVVQPPSDPIEGVSGPGDVVDTAPRPPRVVQGSGSCAIPCLIIAGVVSLILLAAGVAIWRFLAPHDVISLSQDEVRAAANEKYVAARNAFSEDRPKDQIPHYQDLTRLMEQIADAVDETANPAIHRLVDFKRYAREMRRNPELGAMGYIGTTVLSEMVKTHVIGPIPFSEFRIFDVQEIGKHELLVHLQLEGFYSEGSPSRWWISKENNRWKIYDWEPLNYGLRDTRETAIIIGESNFDHVNAYNRYYDLCEAYIELDYDDVDGVRRVLSEVETLDIAPGLRDSALYDTGLRWQYQNEYREAIRVSELIPDPELIPGVYQLRGDCHFWLGEYAAAIESYQNYLDRIGPTRRGLQDIANCYQKLGQTEKEIEFRRRAIPYSDVVYSENTFRILNLSDADGVTDLIQRLVDPYRGEELINLANQIGTNPFFESELELLVSQLQAGHADTPAYHRLAAQLDLIRGKVESGLDHYRRVADQTQDEYSYWSEVIHQDRVLKRFQSTENREAAFHALTSIYESYDHDFDPADMIETCKSRLTQDSENGLASYFAGVAYDDLEDYAAAAVHLSNAIQHLDAEEDPDGYRVDYARQRLVHAFYQTGNKAEALKLVKQTGDYLDIVSLVVEDGDKQLAEFLVSRMDESEEELAPMFKARLHHLLGQSDQAIKILTESLNNAPADGSGLYSSWSFADELVRICETSGKVETAFELAPNQTVFNSVIEKLSAQQDYERCESFIHAAESQLRVDPETDESPAEILNRARSELFWDQRDYASLVRLHRDGLMAPANPGELVARLNSSADRPPMDGNTIRAAIRLGDLAFATELAERLKLENSSSLMPALVALHRKDFEEFERLAKQLQDYEISLLLIDDDFPDIPEADLRRVKAAFGDYFLPRFTQSGTKVFVALEQDPLFEEVDIKTILDGLIGERRTPTVQDDLVNRRTWQSTSSDGIGVITVIPFSGSNVSSPSGAGVSSNAADCQFLTTLYVDVKSLPANEEFRRCADVLRSVENWKPKLIGTDSTWACWDSVHPRLDQVVSGKLRPNELTESWEYVDFSNGHQDLTFEQELARAYRKFQTSSDPDRRLRITAWMDDPGAVASLDMEVERVDRQSYGGNLLIGKLLNQPPTMPRLKNGDQIGIDLFRVVSWELMVDDQTTRGQRD